VHLNDFLTPARVAVPLVAHTKDEILAELVALAAPDTPMRAMLYDEVRAREVVFPTALGDGVALPHVRSPHVDVMRLAAGVLSHPIPFGASDGHPVDVFFLVLSPAHAPSEHLAVLRALSRLLADPGTVGTLRAARTTHAFLETVRSTSAF